MLQGKINALVNREHDKSKLVDILEVIGTKHSNNYDFITVS